MTTENYKSMSGVSETPETLLTVNDLVNKADRTLLYGYTCVRDTWHVYLKDGVIHTVMYPYNGDGWNIIPTCNAGFVPDKRLYPARCDFEFCKLLAERGVYLPFTTYDEEEYEKTKGEVFHGKIKEDDDAVWSDYK